MRQYTKKRYEIMEKGNTNITYMWNLKYDTIRDFSGGPVVETLCFY